MAVHSLLCTCGSNYSPQQHLTFVILQARFRTRIYVGWISMEAGSIWTFLYRRGRPISNVIANYESLNLSIAHFSERNLFRVPDYARLDLSLTIAGKIPWLYPKKDRINSKYKGSLSISIFNVLGRKNAFSVFFKVPENGFTPPKPIDYR